MPLHWTRPAHRAARVALVPAAGVGSRSGAAMPKQHVTVAGRSVLEWTLRSLLEVASIDAVWVVLAPDDPSFSRTVAPAVAQRVGVLPVGGATRAASVGAGLQALKAAGVAAGDWVLVHDAARCLVRPPAVERLIQACLDDPVGGLLALPVSDTIKRCEPTAGSPRVQATVPRHELWAAQTPQMFRLGPLVDALDQAQRLGLEITDEASAMESQGLSPRLVVGDPDNFKVTYPGDFAMAEMRLAADAGVLGSGDRS